VEAGSATGEGIFFVGDSAGHCLPLTAEGIRTAFYFGIACGRELRAVVDGRTDGAGALRAPAEPLLRAAA
jgi:menaquinone-9 beta-reductase